MKRNAIALICMALVALAVFVPAQLAGLLSPARPVSDVAAEQVGDSNGHGSPGSQPGASADVPDDSADESGNAAGGSASAKPEYMPGEMLVGLSDGATVDQLNARLAELDYVATKAVSEDDVSFGFVKLELAQGVDVSDAMERIAREDVVASAEPSPLLVWPMVALSIAALIMGIWGESVLGLFGL